MSAYPEKSKEITFNVIDWQSLDLKIPIKTSGPPPYKKEKRFVIRAFGRTGEDDSVCLEIRDFEPYFFFEIEQEDDGKWINITSNENIEDIRSELKKYINAEEDAYISETEPELKQKEIDEKNILLKTEVFDECVNINICSSCKKFDYFRNNQTSRFLKIKFLTRRAFNLYKKLFKKVSKNENFKFNEKRIRFVQYESNIEPIIRFFHHRDINPSGWIKVSNACKSNPNWLMSRCNSEYSCTHKNVIKSNNNSVALFKIASFDIECTSHDGNFPQAKRIEDKIIQVGITTHRQGEKLPEEYCMITLGPCDDLDNNTNVKNSLLKICKDEKELLLTFTDYINELDPDIITGFNIWGFDWMYMYERSKLLNIEEEFCKMSRITYETGRYIEKTLSSSALGDNLLKYIEMTGRVQIDLFKLIQKDYNLSSYKLNSVSQEFLQGNAEFVYEGDTEEERACLPVHKIKSKSIDGIFVNNQISLIDQEDNKVRDGYKFTVTDLDEDNKIITVKENLKQFINMHNGELEEEFRAQKIKFNPHDIKFRWCENKIDLPPNEIFGNFKKGTADKIREIAVYCIKDCVLCNSLLIKLDVVTKNMGMSNVCCVPLSYLFLRGQGVKVFSVIAKQCREDDFIMPVITKEDYQGDSSYEGAIVLKPQSRIYFKPVAVMDYSSLYPSSMISENISHDSLMKISYFHIKKDDKGQSIIKPDDSVEEDVYEFEELPYKEIGSAVENPSFMDLDNKAIEYNNFDKDKNVIGKTVCYYYQPPNSEKSVLPRVLQKLLQARKDTRKEQKKYNKDDFMWGILEGLQLAYKVTCNSLYGQVGASTSPVCKTELAASTTATGRELLYLAKNMILQNYKNSKCVYGDTDSVFIEFDTTDLGEAIRLGQEAGKTVTEYLISQKRNPHDLEYEKTFYPFILFSKKRYVGNKYEFDINKYSQTSMGIVLKRRDNAKILKYIYKGIINLILNEKNINKALEFFKNALNRIEDFKHDKLVISKNVKGNYKNPTQIAHKILADRIKDRDPGNAPSINDRVPYIYIDVKTLKCNKCNKSGNESGLDLSKCIRCLKLYDNAKILTCLDTHNCKVNSKKANLTSKCFECDITNDNQYCMKCNKWYCNQRQTCLTFHKCNIICRFCHIKLDESHEPCKTSGGFFCKKCKNHNIKSLISTKLLQGDRIEHPEYLEQNPDIKPDFEYYFDHQIQKPVEQIFELADDHILKEFKEIIYIKYAHKRPKIKTSADKYSNMDMPSYKKIT
jgi:DNA polymerase elongation subunit (family B)